MEMANLPTLIGHLAANREQDTLSLAYASISEEGVAEVAKFIRNNACVRYLDLRGNNIQARGAQHLANGIKLNRSLRSLNLKWNCVGKDPAGICALCEALRSNLTVGHVDLRNNRINNLGAKHVGDMLMANTSITHLDLSWNELCVDGGLALLDGLKHNSTVIDCQLAGSKVGEDTLHEVAFLLRRNRAAAAYKASPADTAVMAAAASPQTSTLARNGPAANIASRSLGSQPLSTTIASNAAATTSTGKLTRTQRGAKDDSSLMLRLMMKEREAVLPEEKLFLQQVAEHIDKLLLDSSQHKQGRIDGEEREKLSTTGFIDRESRYTQEIRSHEEGLQVTIADKENLQHDIANQTMDLKRLNNESAQAIRESVASQEQAANEDQQLRRELRDIMQKKRDLQDKVNLNTKDLERLQQENERLRAHVKAFQMDVNEILT